MDEFQRMAFNRKYDELVLFGRFNEEQARQMAITHAFRAVPTIELSPEQWDAEWVDCDRYPMA